MIKNKSAIACWVYDELYKRVPDLMKIKNVADQNRFIQAIIKGLLEAERMDTESERENQYGIKG